MDKPVTRRDLVRVLWLILITGYASAGLAWLVAKAKRDVAPPAASGAR